MEQLSFYSEKMADGMRPRPQIADLSRYYIGASKSIIASSLETGLSKVEVPIVGVDEETGEEVRSFEASVGDCVNVSSDVNVDHPLDGEVLTADQLENGGFFIEKYVKLVDKPPEESENVPDFIKNRPDHLRGVVNIDSLRDYLEEKMINNDNFAMEEYNLSDLFGDAEILEDANGLPTGFVGSIGFKFGVRLCYLPPASFEPPTFTEEQKKIAQLEKAYNVKPASSSPKSRYIFPLASFEKDVFDQNLAEVEWDDNWFGEDLRCYIDNLSRSPEFKLIFDNVFPLKRVASIVSIYSYFGFFSAIGEDPSERHEDYLKEPDEDLDDVWREGLFDTTKHVCFRMFKSYYNTDSWDWNWDWDNDFSFGLFFKDLFPTIFTNLDPSVRWWQRWRVQKTRPFDKEGNECQGPFGEIFKIG